MTHDDLRPDPDALLARVNEEGQRARRGKLKVFFGACPGVGKTYAMLSAAVRLREQGLDVVTGIVESHGRSETARLAEGLESLPRRQVAHRGRMLQEFDLDAALARAPAIVLVDELAHSNAAGSRHPKRWQDVEDLLDAGIDVYSTVNVQHLESLNDVVGGITGIRVWETVPDRVFDEADEVVLVDLPPDDLLQRMREGKVYLAEQAERAVQNFFRKGNLIALRELSLRRTADRVDDEMRSYRREHVGGQVWKTQDAVLVCIGPESGDQKVLRAASRLATGLEVRWHAITIETPQLQARGDSERAALLQTLKLAQQMGAQVADTLSGSDIAAEVVAYARKHNLSKVVLGRHNGPRWRRGWQPQLARRIANLAPDLDLVLVSRTPEEDRKPHPSIGDDSLLTDRERLRSYAVTLAISLAIGLLANPLLELFDLANIVMLFLVGVVIVAVRYGRGPAVLAAIINVLVYDFFFVPPRFSFAVSDVQYLFTFGVMLVVGLVIGQLTARYRFQARVARRREDRSRDLFAMARELSGALAPEQIGETCERCVFQALGARVSLLGVTLDGKLLAVGGVDHAGADHAVAQWVVDHEKPAGLGTDTLPSLQQIYLPLRAPMRTRGVLVVAMADPRPLLQPESRRLLETFAALVAIALERVHFVEVAQDTLVRIESERLRNSLLAALSHDLRTPLTALVGTAEMLAADMAQSDSTFTPRVGVLRDQALRMTHVVENLLEMARLQSGAVQLKSDWESLEEIVGSALQASAFALKAHHVDVQLPADLPLLFCDPALLERVFVNLLENAAKYTPVGSHIGITAVASPGEISVTVWDDGPGLPPGLKDKAFDKFSRGDKESNKPGVGLGLSICRAIIDAHGGRITADNRVGGGALFTLVFPAKSPPGLDSAGQKND